MSLLSRIQAFFRRQREEDEATELARIRLEHERLGERLYWQGGAAGWYHLWNKTPRVRTTIAEQARSLDAPAFSALLLRIHRAVLSYRALPWWKRLFKPNPYKTRDYRLMMYTGSNAYLSPTRGTKLMVQQQVRDAFLMHLRATSKGSRWERRFSRDDRREQEQRRTQAAEQQSADKAQQLLEEMQATKQKLLQARKQCQQDKAWVDVARYTADQYQTVSSDDLVAAAELTSHYVKRSHKALHLAVALMPPSTNNLNEDQLLRASAGQSAASQSQTTSALMDEIATLGREVLAIGRGVLSSGEKVVLDIRKETKRRRLVAKAEEQP